MALILAIAAAGVRAGYILYERHQTRAEEVRKAAPALNADYYVIPKKIYAYDLSSARELTKQPVWVKEGYRYTYYPYDPARRRSDFSHEAGQLGPIQRLEITEVVTDVSPGSPDQRQVMAVFLKEGKSCAFPIGSVQAGEYKIYADEMLYIQDPNELYKHWPADVWQAVEQHKIKPGMSELQAGFAIGMGVPERSADASIKTVKYPNGGHPISVTYRDGKAAEIGAG